MLRVIHMTKLDIFKLTFIKSSLTKKNVTKRHHRQVANNKIIYLVTYQLADYIYQYMFVIYSIQREEKNPINL